MTQKISNFSTNMTSSHIRNEQRKKKRGTVKTLLITHLGAVTRSNVKMTTFCLPFVNITVSPDNTDFTVANPRDGNTGRMAA